jgi:hypothetical protein
MITREKYLEALDVVETYHRQLRQLNGETTLKSWNDLQMGDKIIFSRLVSKNVLIEKEYEVTYVDDDWKREYYSCFRFVCENGSEKRLQKHPRGYRVQIA